MRKCNQNIEQVKADIRQLKGKSLSVSVNRGRKRIVDFDGSIIDVFPSVFVFRAIGAADVMSFSYSDVVCGNVVLKSD